MNTAIMTSGEMVETALHDLSTLIGINALPAPKSVMLWTTDPDQPGPAGGARVFSEVGVRVLLRNVPALTRWADALDVTVRVDGGWHSAALMFSGVQLGLSAYEREGSL